MVDLYSFVTKDLQKLQEYIMKYLIIVAFFLIGSLAVFSQEKHFMFIQTDNNQAFYVQLNGKLFSSSATGYMILPKLVKGNYNFIVGFPQNAYPEQSFECVVDNKDLGFNLKNFGDKGWGLFNLQTYEVVKAMPANANESPKIVIAETQKVEDREPVISFDKKTKETPKPIVQEPSIVTNETLNKEPITTLTVFKADIKSPDVKSGKNNKPAATKPIAIKPVISKPIDTVAVVAKPIETIAVVETVPLIKAPLKEEGTFIVYINEPDIKISKKVAEEITVLTAVDSTSLTTVPIKTEEALKVDIVKPEVKIVEPPAILKSGNDTITVANTKSDVKKVNEIKNDEGLSMTFVDEKGQVKDTIQAVIPIIKVEIVATKIDTQMANIEKPQMQVDSLLIKTESIGVKGEPNIIKADSPLEKQEPVFVKKDEPVIKPENPILKTEIKENKIDTPAIAIKEPITAVVQSIANNPTPIVESKPAVFVKDTIVPQSIAYDSPLNENKKNIKSNISDEPNKQIGTYIVTNKCTALAFEEDYYKLRKKMLNQMSDEKMISEAKKVYETKCFTTAQVKALSVLFMSDEGRYKFFDMSYNYIIDTDKFPALQSELIDPYYLGRFKAMLR